MKKTHVNSNVDLNTLAGGAFAEKVNEALVQVGENIQNQNTEATKKRKITITMTFAPNKTRQLVNTQIGLQMLALLPDSLKGIDLVDWQGYYNQEKAGTFKMVIRALVPYGFSITEEDEKQILDGTHELYAVKEK